jgi:hypothetical protein
MSFGTGTRTRIDGAKFVAGTNQAGSRGYQLYMPAARTGRPIPGGHDGAPHSVADDSLPAG